MVRVVTSEKVAQKVIDDLCSKHQLPTIKVIMRRNLGREDIDAFFNPETYQIEFVRGVSSKVLHHEFFHYALHVIRIAEEVEEVLSDAFAGLR